MFIPFMDFKKKSSEHIKIAHFKSNSFCGALLVIIFY